MKKIRIISLLLALIIVCPIFAACGSNETVAHVTIKFVCPDGENGEMIERLSLDGFAVMGTVSEPPTALKAAQQVLNEYEVSYSLTDDGHSIAGIWGYENEETYDDTYGYFKYWKCTINDVEPAEGRMSQALIAEGQTVVFTYTEGKELRKDTQEEETVNPEDFETSAVTLPPKETETAPEE